MFKRKKQINPNAKKKIVFDKNKQTHKYVFFEETINPESFQFINDFSEVIMPQKNKQTFVLSTKNRSYFDLLENRNCSELIFFCGTINNEGYYKIKNLNIFGAGIQDYVKKNNPNLYKEIQNKTNVKFTNNHSKMLIFQSNDNFYVIEGSGNPSINERNEFYIIHNNEKMYNEIKNLFKNV